MKHLVVLFLSVLIYFWSFCSIADGTNEDGTIKQTTTEPTSSNSDPADLVDSVDSLDSLDSLDSVDPKSVQVSAGCSSASGSFLTKYSVGMRRYIVLQLCDTNGRNLTFSPLHLNLKVEMNLMTHSTYARNQIKPVQIMDRGDGTYLGIYTQTESYYRSILSISINSEPIKGSPFILNKVLSESCDCPHTQASQWREEMKCSTYTDFLKNITKPFEKGISKELILKTVDRFKGNANAIIRYVIKDNKIYSKTHTSIAGFKVFSDRFLLSLARKVKLPDTDFIFNLGDYPLSAKGKDSYPILSGCVDDRHNDILVPTWVMFRYVNGDATEDVLRYDGASFSKKKGWNNKIDKLFFRGRDANPTRLRLAEISKSHPDLIDAGITHYFFYRDKEATIGKVPSVPMIDNWDYKYIFNIDGTVAAYRLMALLAGDSLVLKQDSSYVEWFYYLLKPYQHYVPVKSDLSDLVEQVKWSQEHQNEAQQIVRNARKVMRENMRPEDIYCVFYDVLQEYSSKLNFIPVVEEDMEEVEEKIPSSCDCTFLDMKREREEL